MHAWKHRNVPPKTQKTVSDDADDFPQADPDLAERIEVLSAFLSP
jgi:hypothetical protein